MQKYTFSLPGSARRGAISRFPLNYGEIHQIPPIIGGLLIIPRFGVEFTTFRPKAETLAWCQEIIGISRAILHNYHVLGWNSSIIGEFHHLGWNLVNFTFSAFLDSVAKNV